MAFDNTHGHEAAGRGRRDGTLVRALKTLEADRQNDAAWLTLGKELLAAGQAAEAEHILRRACEMLPKDRAIHCLYAEACLEAGTNRNAVKAAKHASNGLPKHLRRQLHVASILASAGKLEMAEETLSEVPDAFRVLSSIYEGLARQLRKHRKFAEALVLAERACTLNPTARDMQLLRAECLAMAGNARAGLEAFDAWAPVHGGESSKSDLRTHKIMTRTLQREGDAAEEIARLEQLVQAEPGNEWALRHLHKRHTEAGNAAAAQEYRELLEPIRKANLPVSLAAGLAALRPKDSNRGYLPPGMAWAWQLADKAIWQQDAWRAGVKWGRRADMLMSSWWRFAPERHHEIDALMDVPENAFGNIVQGNGPCIFVGSHLGPLVAGARYLYRCKGPFRWLGYAGIDPLVPELTRIPITSNPAAALRELARAIKDGAMIWTAGDPAVSSDSYTLEFLGRTIKVPSLTPRLIWKFGLPSVWWQPLWRDRRIAMQIDRLPDPADGEAFETWCRRWMKAYLGRLEAVMRGAPENLNTVRGIWGNATPESRTGARSTIIKRRTSTPLFD